MSWLARLKKVEPVSTSSPKPEALAFQKRHEAAANDPASSEPPALKQPPAPTPARPAKSEKLKFMDWADGWRELDQAYQRHHWSCPQCKAAGRGAGYGLRCGVGAALWRAYEDASAR